ncbi:MAG: OmpH family outer membrane protein [Lysobacterales bacterium]|jgi:outer membrane protein
MSSCVRTICVILLSLACISPAFAQQSLRIGYVDMKEVLDNAPQVIAGRAKLDQEFRERNDAIELDEMRADSLEQRLGQGDVDSEDRIRLERDLRELRRSVSRRKEDLMDELSFRRTEEVQLLEEQINVAVQEIARRNGYDLIVSSPVIYASPALDITDLILEQLEVEYAADQLELATD